MEATVPTKKYIDSVRGNYNPSPAKCEAIARRFVIDWNPGAALRAGGYSDKTVNSHCSVLIQHPAIQEAIERVRAEILDKFDVSVEYVLHGLYELAEKSLGRKPVIQIGPDGESIETLTFQPSAAKGALETLARYHGILTDKVAFVDGMNIDEWVNQANNAYEAKRSESEVQRAKTH